MRIIGIDYGTVRTGMAVSDPSALIAKPLGFIRCDALSIEDLACRIAEKYTEVNAGKIVIGLPKHMSGDEGTHAGKVRELAAILETKLNIKVDYLDERLTSVSAEKLLIEGNMSREKRKEKIDSVAACIILQSYLDAKSGS